VGLSPVRFLRPGREKAIAGESAGGDQTGPQHLVETLVVGQLVYQIEAGDHDGLAPREAGRLDRTGAQASSLPGWGSPLPVCRRGCPAPDTLVVGGSARRSSQDSSCSPLLEIVVPTRDDPAAAVRQLFVLSGTPASISHAGKGRVLFSLSLCTYRKSIMPGVCCQAPLLPKQPVPGADEGAPEPTTAGNF
jgi:hypothetical protein